MVESLNLCVMHKCAAKCIFCPQDRGTCDTTITGMMDDIVFTKLITNAKHSGIKNIKFGENGDCFLHPQIIDMLRYTKEHIPNSHITLFTNFLSGNTEQWQQILVEDLVQHVVCNIDSINPKQYRNAKNADFYQMWNNFTAFIRLRDIYHKFNSTTISVNIIDPDIYSKTFATSFGMFLSHTALQDTSEQTMNTIKYLLHSKDEVITLLPCFWAERKYFEKIPIPENSFCPKLKMVEEEAFFAPDGTWYACCLDSKNELKLGNIREQTIEEIEKGNTRHQLLAQLRRGDFKAIGGPCRTVVACHHYRIGGEKYE